MCQVNIISLEKDVKNCYVSIILSELTTAKQHLKGLGGSTKIEQNLHPFCSKISNKHPKISNPGRT